MDLLCIEDLRVGDRWVSRGRTITESDITSFACLTGDFDPLHVDHEFARQTPFGRPIAHGLLGLSLVAGLSSNWPAVHTEAFLGIEQWQFRLPLFVGDTVHVVNEVVAITNSNGRRGQVRWKRQLVNQAGAVVQEGTLATLVSAAAIRQKLHLRRAA